MSVQIGYRIDGQDPPAICVRQELPDNRERTEQCDIHQTIGPFTAGTHTLELMALVDHGETVIINENSMIQIDRFSQRNRVAHEDHLTGDYQTNMTTWHPIDMSITFDTLDGESVIFNASLTLNQRLYSGNISDGMAHINIAVCEDLPVSSMIMTSGEVLSIKNQDGNEVFSIDHNGDVHIKGKIIYGMLDQSEPQRIIHIKTNKELINRFDDLLIGDEDESKN